MHGLEKKEVMLQNTNYFYPIYQSVIKKNQCSKSIDQPDGVHYVHSRLTAFVIVEQIRFLWSYYKAFRVISCIKIEYAGQ